MFKPFHQRFLKIKIKSLSAESIMIRREEKRAEIELLDKLHYHRTFDVRIESRAAQLAYAYLRGRAFPESTPKPGWDYYRNKAFTRAKQIVKKFGLASAQEGFNKWLQGVEATRCCN